MNNLRYFKKYIDSDEKKEITYEEALKTLLTTYKDNDITRDMLTELDEIPCRLSTVFVEKESNTNDKFNVGDKVIADGLVCEIVDAGEDIEDGTTWYEVTPVTGYAHGFVRSFTADKLLKVQ